MMPDYRPPNLDDLIRSIKEKSRVLYFPIKFCHVPLMHTQTREKTVLHIIWPHRWYEFHFLFVMALLYCLFATQGTRQESRISFSNFVHA